LNQKRKDARMAGYFVLNWERKDKRMDRIFCFEPGKEG